MSIGLFLGHRDPSKEDSYVRIASDEVFASQWKPACAALGLRWIPRFPTGSTLTPEDIPPILAELDLLKNHFDGLAGSDVVLQIRIRIQELSQSLKDAHGQRDVEPFIGYASPSNRRPEVPAKLQYVVRSSARKIA